MNTIAIAADAEGAQPRPDLVAASLPATLYLVADTADVLAVSGAAGWVERAIRHFARVHPGSLSSTPRRR